MAARRGAWLAGMARARLQGRAGRDRFLRDRYERAAGERLPQAPPYGLTALLTRRMVEANRSRDVTLAPYVDKLAVREYVARTAGPRLLVPLLWSGRNVMAIPFGSPDLPAVLKPNHMSQAVLVLTADADPWRVRRRALRWLADNYYWAGGEYQYRAIPPRLMLEEFLDDGTEHGPRDYSFWCVRGEPLFVQVRDTTGELRQAYDLQWRPLPVLQPGARAADVAAPAALERMAEDARRLAEPFGFVRVDFYDVDGRPFFGELTFTPAGGDLRLSSPGVDAYLGELVAAGSGPLRGAAARSARTRLIDLVGEGFAYAASAHRLGGSG